MVANNWLLKKRKTRLPYKGMIFLKATNLTNQPTNQPTNQSVSHQFHIKEKEKEKKWKSVVYDNNPKR